MSRTQDLTFHLAAPTHPRWSTGGMDNAAEPLTDADTLVIDGANVVGSRPDGWWRDRAGAAARLHARLIAAAPIAPHTILVLEGQARAGVTEGDADGLAVVHARGEGDDTIVDEARRALATGSVAVATADRGLIARVEQLGARVVKPGRLLDSL